MASSILDGWLRIAGEKFYAFTRPKTVIIDENTGKTLEDVLDKFNADELIKDIQKLQKDLDDLKQQFDRILDQVGLYNIQTGVYTALKEDIESLSTPPELSKLDNNVLYIVTDDDSLVSVVNIRVLWKTRTGELLKSETYTGRVGETVAIPFFVSIERTGRIYKFDKTLSTIKDLTTGKITRIVEIPTDSSETATTWFTKNVTLELHSNEEV